VASSFELLNQANITFLQNYPIMLAQQTTLQAVANATIVPITWPTPSVDNFVGWASGNPTRYTPVVPGYYAVTGQIGWVLNATGDRITLIYKNGVAVAQASSQPPTANDLAVVQCYWPLIHCNGTTDYLEIYGLQRSGGSLNTSPTVTQIAVEFKHF
jgi:hypothetical protein